MIEKNKKLFVTRNSYPATRNSQRVAFTMEPLIDVIKAEPFGLGYLLYDTTLDSFSQDG